MEKKRRKMNRANMEYWTHQTKARMDGFLDLAQKFQNDPQKAERIVACLCRLCFYDSRFGGAAITDEPCMSCGKPQTYGSTSTDALCLECAQETGLCKHCGGDRELRVNCRNWPAPKVPE